MAAPRKLGRITVAQAADRYQEWLRLRVAMGALAASTQEAYARDVAEFVRLIGPQVVLDDVEAEDIELALVRIANAPDRRYTRRRKLDPRGEPAVGRGLHARARWLASVRGLFRWAADNGYVQVDPTPRVSRVRVPQRAKGARLGLSVEEALALRETPAALPSTKSNTVRADQRLALRDEVILRLLTETGPRVSEICAANRDDVRVHEETGQYVLRIRAGKGGKSRDVPLSPTLVELIRRYEQQERPRPPRELDEDARADAERALVVTIRGRRMTPRDIQRMVHRHVRFMPAHLRQQVTPHGLRHTAATVLLRYAHTDVATVADILGHADIATTSIYLDPSAVAAAQALQRSPLAQPEPVRAAESAG
ncbi:tyrosine-type recombinase/integrase [Carbonactinospora thermoautotrophica]|uniref:tyrosine-type recombinase/integrase n=1 Tax=Carbonactinospora thermoautotrophica TaxID=1469144 RepID=UPI003DAA33AB